MNNAASISAAKRIGIALVASLAVASLGSITWVPLVIANTKFLRGIPWSVAAEGVALLLIWKYLGGCGWPRRTAHARSELLRARLVPTRQLVWAVIAGGLSLVALAGLWIVLVRLTSVGGNPTLPYLSGYSPLVVVLVIGMASLVSPLSEEAAFRGYAQVLLERHFLPVVAVGISSVFFALYHGPTQGFAPSKLFFYLVVGVVFGTIAYMTRSTLPALPVHIAGDLLFFLVIWPGDAGRSVVWSHGTDLMFWANVLQVLVFSALAVLAFRRLMATRAATPKGEQTSSRPSDLRPHLMISPQSHTGLRS